MPGIVGIIQRKKDAQIAEAELRSMLRTMGHEAFYQTGSVSLPERNCYVGWTALGSAPDSAASIVSDTGNVLVAFSGEDFSQRSGVGASTLLSDYETKGMSALRGLNGWFAGVLVDRSRNLVVLFNDRFGMHRIYWCEQGESFCFASEAKALLSIRPETRSFPGSTPMRKEIGSPLCIFSSARSPSSPPSWWRFSGFCAR